MLRQDAAEFFPLHWSDTILHSSEEVGVAWFFFRWSCFRCCAMRFFYLIEPSFNPPSKSIDYENTKNCGKPFLQIIAIRVNNNFLNGDKFYLFFLKKEVCITIKNYIFAMNFKLLGLKQVF